MLFQLRERDASISPFSSGTFISPDGNVQSLEKDDFHITVLDSWRSPHTGGVYPSAWEIDLNSQNCQLTIQPWMNDQELHFTTVTYWEGAVRFQGVCGSEPVTGNGYIEMTGYAGHLPLP
jgi:predicted secreted hydrolase